MVSWWTGRHFGPGAADWLIRHHPGSKRSVDRCERLIDRFGIASVLIAPWLPLPTVLLYAANGWRRMPLPVFIATDIAGTTIRAAVMILIGYGAGDGAVRAVRLVSDDSGYATAAIVVAAIAVIAVRARGIRIRGTGAGAGADIGTGTGTGIAARGDADGAVRAGEGERGDGPDPRR
jgi:membrane-associated protein